MLVIEKTLTYGWEAAIRGMRNPKNSWDMIDTDFSRNPPELGPNDLRLAGVLAAAGTDHGKYLRMVCITMDVTAPFYWWKEFDTYKVGTVADSCSTMHKIQAKEFVPEDFSNEHMNAASKKLLALTINELNRNRDLYNETKDKEYWWQMIQLLPTSYNQKRTVLLNYAVLKNIYHSRRSHKLDEWHTFCAWIEQLPYAELITAGNRA